MSDERLFGAVEIPAEAHPGQAFVVVTLLDTRMMDVGAVEIARVEMPGVEIEPGGRVPFEIVLPPAEASSEPIDLAELTLSAAIGFAPDRGRRVGDLLTTEHVPASVLSLRPAEPGLVPTSMI